MRMLRVLGLATATMLSLGALIPSASASASARTVTITVVGIDRAGAQVAVQSSVVPLTGNAEPSSGPTYTLVPGTYFIGAAVTTMAGGNPASDTIVVRRIHVTASGTIRLDARGGKLVSVFLNGRDLGSPGISGGCIRGGYGVIYPESGAPLVYLQPVRVADVGFDWAVSVPGPGSSTYDLAGGTATGLPASPVYRVKSSQLSRTVIQAKAGAVPDTGAAWSTFSTESDGCGLPGAVGSGGLPLQATVYRTPGEWRTEVDTQHGTGLIPPCSMTWTSHEYAAGHHYTDTFESAVHGPAQAVPFVAGNSLSFNPSYQFSDPKTQGYEYCQATTVSLSHGGHVLKTQRFTSLVGLFTAKVAARGWYVLQVNARQTAPGEAVPAGLLSPRTSLTWRFKVGPGPVPVAVISFQPQGLNVRNQASPGSLTRIRAWSTQSQYVYPPGPASAARSFMVQVSYNNGTTWHVIRVNRLKGYWQFAVRNPRSGYVTLRSTTVNAAGDSSVQTIYRAYQVR
jgi:hypothetical protein